MAIGRLRTANGRSQQQSGWPQPQNSSQINAVDDTGDSTSQDCNSPDEPQDTITGTANGTTTEPAESSRPGNEITGRGLNTSFSTAIEARLIWPVTHQQLGVPLSTIRTCPRFRNAC